MVKNNQNRPRPKNRQHPKDRPKKPFANDRERRSNRFSRKSGNPRFKNRKFEKKTKSVDQLDKELEMYWGNEVGSKHLDKDMDDYWQGKKDDTKE
jgi:hypothetical protein